MSKLTAEELILTPLNLVDYQSGMDADDYALYLGNLVHVFLQYRKQQESIHIDAVDPFFKPDLEFSNRNIELVLQKCNEIIDFFCFVLENKSSSLQLSASRDIVFVLTSHFEKINNLLTVSELKIVVGTFLQYLNFFSRMLTEKNFEYELKNHQKNEKNLIRLAKITISIFSTKFQRPGENHFLLWDRLESDKRTLLLHLEKIGLLHTVDQYQEKSQAQIELEAIAVLILSKRGKLSALGENKNGVLGLLAEEFKQRLEKINTSIPIRGGNQREESTGRQVYEVNLQLFRSSEPTEETTRFDIRDLFFASTSAAFAHTSNLLRDIPQPDLSISLLEINIGSLIEIIKKEFTFSNVLNLIHGLFLVAEFRAETGVELNHLLRFYLYIQELFLKTQNIELSREAKNSQPELPGQEFASRRSILSSLQRIKNVLESEKTK